MSTAVPNQSAWAGDPPGREAARSRLLAAAMACVARDGLPGLSIAAVAAEAGVSRPTVYRYFRDRSALVQAALLHASDLFVDSMQTHLAALRTPRERAVEVVVRAVRDVPRHPVLGRLWNTADLDGSALRGFTGAAAISLSREATRPLAEAAGWTSAEADEATEVLLRFIVSLLAAPEPKRTETELRAFLERRLLPALGLATTPA